MRFDDTRVFVREHLYVRVAYALRDDPTPLVVFWKRFQMASQYTVAMHWMVWFSHCTVCFPSTFPSQSAVDAVCIPAPAFCTKLHVTTYLNGFCSPARRFKHPSTTFEVHWFTFVCMNALVPTVCSIACARKNE